MTGPDSVSARLVHARHNLERRRGEALALAAQGQRLQAELADLARTVELHEKATVVLTAIGEQRQDDAQRQIENLVTLGLRTIFEEDLDFRLVPGVRAKTPVVDLVVSSTLADGTRVDTDVLAARGGGLAAIVGFLLRLVILLLGAHRQDTVLFLDETFAHVSAEYLPRLTAFLADLVERTGVQIVLVTHDETVPESADLVYRLSLHSGLSRAVRL